MGPIYSFYRPPFIKPLGRYAPEILHSFEIIYPRCLLRSALDLLTFDAPQQMNNMLISL